MRWRCEAAPFEESSLCLSAILMRRVVFSYQSLAMMLCLGDPRRGGSVRCHSRIPCYRGSFFGAWQGFACLCILDLRMRLLLE
jgi:hypothetical protein